MTPLAPAAARAPSRAAGTGMILFSACCFGAISTLVVVANRAGATLFTVLALRYLIATAVMFPVAWRDLFVDRHRAPRLFVAGGVGQALIAGVSLSSLRWIDAATLGFLFYTYPAWVALIAAARRTEPLDRRKLIALSLSLVGIAFIVARPGSAAHHPIGVILALLAAVVYAAYIPLIGAMQGPVPAPAATAWIGAGAAVAFVIIATVTGQWTFEIALAGWAAIVTLALVCTGLAFVLFLRGLAALGPVRTAIVSTVEPFFTAVIAALVLGQPLASSTLLGGSCIAIAVVVLQLRQSPQAARL